MKKSSNSSSKNDRNNHVSKISGVRSRTTTVSGRKCNKQIQYDLYGPKEAELGVIYLHGFGGNKSHLSSHAEALLKELLPIGDVEQKKAAPSQQVKAFLPNLIPLTDGGGFREIWIEHNVRSAQLANVQKVIDHIENFLTPLKKYAIVGHSAGGAIALEVAIALQQETPKDSSEQRQLKIPPPSVCVLLDAVPWDDTVDLCHKYDLCQTKLVSIRCEPSAWNKNCVAMTNAIQNIPNKAKYKNQLINIKLPTSQHGDAMPPSFVGRMLGIVGTGYESMRDLSVAAVLDGIVVEEESESRHRTLEQVIKDLRDQNKLQQL